MIGFILTLVFRWRLRRFQREVESIYEEARKIR